MSSKIDLGLRTFASLGVTVLFLLFFLFGIVPVAKAETYNSSTSTSSTATTTTGTASSTTSTSTTGGMSTSTGTGSTTGTSTGTSTATSTATSTPGTGSTTTPSTGTSTSGMGTSTGTSTGGTTGTSTGTTTSPGTGTSTATTTPPSTGTSTDSDFFDHHYALNDGGLTYETDLRTRNEVGQAGTTSTSRVSGEAGVWFEPEGKDMNYWAFINSNQRPETITAAHLHCGMVGQNGPVAVSLFSNASGTTIASGELARGKIRNADISASGTSCATAIGYQINTVADLAKAITEGKIYVNVHSEAFPEGITRGQLQQVTRHVTQQEFDRLQRAHR